MLEAGRELVRRNARYRSQVPNEWDPGQEKPGAQPGTFS